MTTPVRRNNANGGLAAGLIVGIFALFCLCFLAVAYFRCLGEKSRRRRRHHRRSTSGCHRRSARSGDTEAAGVQIPEQAHLPEETEATALRAGYPRDVIDKQQASSNPEGIGLQYDRLEWPASRRHFCLIDIKMNRCGAAVVSSQPTWQPSDVSAVLLR